MTLMIQVRLLMTHAHVIITLAELITYVEVILTHAERQR